MDKISVKANAKINLGLDIVGIRDDGYHLLKTVMQSVSLYDIIALEKANDISVICSDETLPCGEQNLAFKAAKLFFEETKIVGGVKISIEKNIPSQAGLGGGSADAAGTIFALNKLYNADLSDEKLCEIGEKVGSDVPFCIVGGTKLCEGIGERLTSLKPVSD
ncbi:MAG: 4-(cytidine 5'-diphospho)-2-C-methyl-D-erythritol kinase, partial [Oscillospiraceae bacterium]|nr:4-(cytidine 5'-diphospho)-2-C-methyl-D-erythritol kinase [Oscillospiraceae bacterium]